jgi:hypothetical protein
MSEKEPRKMTKCMVESKIKVCPCCGEVRNEDNQVIDKVDSLWQGRRKYGATVEICNKCNHKENI